MILSVPLRAGTTLANVRYEWIAGGIAGGVLSSGITQPSGSYPVFRIVVTPPPSAEELIVFDVSDNTNWNVGEYRLALVVPSGVPVPPPIVVAVPKQVILV